MSKQLVPGLDGREFGKEIKTNTYSLIPVPDDVTELLYEDYVTTRNAYFPDYDEKPQLLRHRGKDGKVTFAWYLIVPFKNLVRNIAKGQQ